MLIELALDGYDFDLHLNVHLVDANGGLKAIAGLELLRTIFVDRDVPWAPRGASPEVRFRVDALELEQEFHNGRIDYA